MEFGPFIRARRESAKLSLAALGRVVGVSKQYLYAIESGEIRPSADMCHRLAHALRLDLDVVLLTAGYTPLDVLSLLQENPKEGCALLRRSLGTSSQ